MLNQNSSEYKIDNKNSICFDRGRFDDYCVFFKKFDNNNNLISKKAVKDIELFDNLLIFKKEYKDKVYKLIKFIFDYTNSTLNFKTIDKTVKLVNKHFDGSISAHKYFLFVYYAMVAEEKKTNSKLGKRIKLLGIYQILNEKFSSQTAANFSRGLKWTVIDEECKRRGF